MRRSPEHGPAVNPQTVLEEGAQGTASHLHGGGAELADLAQFEVIGAHLVLGERGRVALVMIAEPADVTDVFFFGGIAKVFELDKRGEFGDRWMSSIHTAASVPVSAETCSPPIKTCHPSVRMKPQGPSTLRQARRAAAAFNQSPEPTWLGAAVLRKAVRVYHVAVPTWLSFFR